MAGSLIAAAGRRLLLALSLLLAVVVLIFTATQWLPGSVAHALLGQQATPEAIAALERTMGLDGPAWQRLLRWLGQLLQGDLGISYVSRQPVWQELAPRLTNSLTLAALVAICAVPLSLLMAMTSVLYQGRLADRLLGAWSRLSVALPEFFTGYLLILLFAVHLDWLPSSAVIRRDMPLAERLYVMILPAAVLLLAIMGHITGMARAALLNAMTRPHIEMAMIKGVDRRRIVFRHALPNAWAPIVNVIALNLAYLIVGVMVVEVIFVYPGIGQYMVDSVLKRDMPAIQACAVIFGALYIALNTLADLISTLSNPRLRGATA